MPNETMAESHQISNLSIGPDGKLYVHLGDGFDPNTARNLNSFRGKILRMNLDGTAPSDNPFYNASDGIGPRDYVFVYGVQITGGAWRAADGERYRSRTARRSTGSRRSSRDATSAGAAAIRRCSCSRSTTGTRPTRR
jgi:glucose/arabinose dehydrogenase